MKHAHVICALILAFLMSSCANLNSINHTFSTSKVPDKTVHTTDSNNQKTETSSAASRIETISVDSQQRFLVQTFAKDIWKSCAEPSPDTFSSFSGGTGASLTSKADVAASLATSFAQQAAALGLRTQTITILRDEAFRLCEGFANGAIESNQFETLHRRFQNAMIGNLAIEQLTGYARPTVITLGGGAAATTAGGLPQAQASLDAAKKQLDDKKTLAASADAASIKATGDAKAAQDALTAGAGGPNVADLQAAVNAAKVVSDKAAADKLQADEDVKEEEKNVIALTDARDAARSNTSRASSNPAQIGVPVAGTAITADVATAVKNIVDLIVYRDYTKDTCLDFLVGTQASGADYTEVKKLCLNIITALNAELTKASNEDRCVEFLTGQNANLSAYSDTKKLCLKVVAKAAAVADATNPEANKNSLGAEAHTHSVTVKPVSAPLSNGLPLDQEKSSAVLKKFNSAQ